MSGGPVTEGVRRTTLPNGLRLLTEQVPGARSFSVGFFVPVGSRQETPALAGASHFLEHLLFKGTRRRSAEDISVAVESVGGDLNAYTTKEHTCFYARVLDIDAALAVDVLADMITDAALAAADVESERPVIIDEIAMHADDPGEVAQELITDAILGDRGLGAPVIGNAGNIAALSRTQIKRHRDRWYAPQDLVVAATGHVDHDRLAELLAPLGDGVTTARPRRTPPTVIRRTGGVATAVRSVGQLTAVLAQPGPGHLDPDRYAVGLLSIILGGGMSSRLFVEVRERRGLTYGIDAGETTFSDAGLWSVEWQCAPGRLADILEVVRGCIGDVLDHGVGADELARAKSQLRGQTRLAFEGPVARMSRLGSNALIGDDRSLDALLDAYDAVGLDDLQAAAQRVLGGPPTLALVGPRVGTRRIETRLADWPG